MKSSAEVRQSIGSALRRARGQGSVHGAGESGVGYRTVDRLESARKERIELSTVYLLAMFYGVSLHAVLDVDHAQGKRRDLGTWPAGMPSLPAVDAGLRICIREARQLAGLGTPTLGRLARVEQAWLVRYEAGEASRVDVVRLYRVAHMLKTSLPALLPGASGGRDGDGAGEAGGEEERAGPARGGGPAAVDRSGS